MICVRGARSRHDAVGAGEAEEPGRAAEGADAAADGRRGDVELEAGPLAEGAHALVAGEPVDRVGSGARGRGERLGGARERRRRVDDEAHGEGVVGRREGLHGLAQLHRQRRLGLRHVGAVQGDDDAGRQHRNEAEEDLDADAQVRPEDRHDGPRASHVLPEEDLLQPLVGPGPHAGPLRGRT